VTYGHVTPDGVSSIISDFLRHEQAGMPGLGDVERRGEIRIGLGSCCVARGSGKLRQALEEALEQTGVDVAVKRVGCVGMCYQTPLLEVVLPPDRSFLYARVRPEDARAIVLRHFKVPRITKRISNKVSAVLDGIFAGRRSEPVGHYSIDVRGGDVRPG